jgi:hypothetical protein
MIKRKPTYDVFISHSARDVEFASEVARVLRSYDLSVFEDAAADRGENWEDSLWNAMAESQAMVAVISESEPSARAAVELGAATAWNKPIFAIAANPAATRLPPSLRGIMVYSPARIDEIAVKIKQSSGSLSDSEKAILVDEYHRIGIPLDQLVLQPWQLARLTKQFVKRSKRQCGAEELVRVLLRIRKTGALRPKIERPGSETT